MLVLKRVTFNVSGEELNKLYAFVPILNICML